VVQGNSSTALTRTANATPEKAFRDKKTLMNIFVESTLIPAYRMAMILRMKGVTPSLVRRGSVVLIMATVLIVAIALIFARR
jgi:hypothetical protein